ncbi:DoxX family protein [Herbaspirillum robiniae]|uniref:DoxX family protein n=1 Tax=Herbaspirillum robiniae TaxID=2014887 RepID=A0A246WM60_9BURK|nr:DoxX family protein [Herbaspirillum robiniae]NUU02954.1 DoxX family protein [Herbaspirillum robiniae]OWY27414.1 LysR family transcriptional regulator [Herbaspirillum robiniae]
MTTVTTNTKADYAALLLRVTMGIFFLVHAGLKIFVFTPAGTVGFFASLGVPGFLAYPVILLEVVGGIALVLGFYGRWLAIPLALDLLGAIVLVHGPAGFFFTNPKGGWEYLALWIVGLVAVFLLGDGAYAIKRDERK